MTTQIYSECIYCSDNSCIRCNTSANCWFEIGKLMMNQSAEKIKTNDEYETTKIKNTITYIETYINNKAEEILRIVVKKNLIVFLKSLEQYLSEFYPKIVFENGKCIYYHLNNKIIVIVNIKLNANVDSDKYAIVSISYKNFTIDYVRGLDKIKLLEINKIINNIKIILQ